MSKAITHYINETMAYANAPEEKEPALRAELEDHLLTKVDEIEQKGEPREDAIFRAIKEYGEPSVVGYGLRKFRWIDVRSRGTARGFIAVGPRAVGVFAFGGFSMGIFSFGGFSVGVFGIGGFCLTLLFGWGGFVIAPLGLAYAGVAFGLVAVGGMAFGGVAWGGTATGLFAQGATTSSLWNFADAPLWLKEAVSWVFPTDMSGLYNIYNLALVIGWIIIFAFGIFLQMKEEERLKKALARCGE